MHSSSVHDHAVVVGPGQGERAWFLRNLSTIKAGSDTTAGAYGLVESLLAPGFSPPLHVHDREDEAFYVLEGNLTFRNGEETIAAVSGTYVFLPRGVPHTFVVEDTVPARVLTLMSPGGGEQFFIDGGRPALSDGLPPDEPLDVAALKRAADRYGSRIVGPPLSPTGRVNR